MSYGELHFQTMSVFGGRESFVPDSINANISMKCVPAEKLFTVGTESKVEDRQK